MTFIITLSPEAKKHYKKIKKTYLIKKYFILIDKIKINPYAEGNSFKRLKGNKSETYSRRINEEHRLVYEVKDEIITILIISCWGHYDD